MSGKFAAKRKIPIGLGKKMNGPARSKRTEIQRLKSIESTISSGHDLELANRTSESSENLEGMGIFRSEGDRILVSHGSVSVCGRRREMEDAVTVAPGLAVAGDSVRYYFFGVYDGHGGSVVAEACRKRVHRIVETELEMRGGGGDVNWKNVMEACFEQMDGEILEKTIALSLKS